MSEVNIMDIPVNKPQKMEKRKLLQIKNLF